MSCCTRYCVAETQFDTKRAESDLRQYQHDGMDAVTSLLVEELRQRKLEGADLLDIGAGIGVIAAELAQSGVAKATVVEASPAYLDVARRKVGSIYAEGRAQFSLGDFSLIGETLTDAEVVTLNRVVCCYPDAETLLTLAGKRTRRMLAFTYPRDRWFVRAATWLENFWRRLRGNAFRTYVHLPRQMEAAVETAGLVRVAQRGTSVWMLDVYERR